MDEQAAIETPVEIVEEVEPVLLPEEAAMEPFGDLGSFDGLELPDIGAVEATSSPAIPHRSFPSQSPLSHPAQRTSSAPARPKAKRGNSETVSSIPILPIAIGAAGMAFLMLTVGGIVFWLTRSDSTEVTTSSSSASQSSQNVSQAKPKSYYIPPDKLSESETPWGVAAANHKTHLAKSRKLNASLRSSATAASKGKPSTEKPIKPMSSDEVIDRIKGATVYIIASSRSGVQTGSGVLVWKEGTGGRIITNAHVVSSVRLNSSLSCIFHSGTNQEFRVSGRLVAVDERSDLATLFVSRKNLPEPLGPLPKQINVKETTTVIVAGFPFGESLGTGDRKPAITVTKTSISSIRRNKAGEVALLQLEGGVDPGNSGGPVVAEDGRLAGIAVAKISGSNIGFAIPTERIRQFWNGRVSEIGYQRQPLESSAKLKIVIKLINPQENIQEVELIAFSRSSQTMLKPLDDGSWGKAAEKVLATKVVRPSRSDEHCDMDVPLDQKDILLQAHWVRKDGTEVYSRPMALPSGIIANGTKSRIAVNSHGDGSKPEIIASIEGSKLVSLATSMSDFAMNRKNGDVAAVSSFENSAYLIRAEQFESMDHDQYPRLSFREKPTSILWKNINDQSYFLVACHKESSLYVVDHKTFKLTKKIPVTGGEVVRIACSTNPSDPFVYYSYRDGNNLSTGVIDLRLMVDRGKLFGFGGNFDASRSGGTLFVQGANQSRNYASFRRVNELTADKPDFIQEHVPMRCSPSFALHDHFIESDSLILASIARSGHPLLTNSQVFQAVPNTPALIGLGYSGPTTDTRLTLTTYSTNTWSPVGLSIGLPRLYSESMVNIGKPRVPRSSHGGAVPIKMSARLMLDRANQRVVVGVHDKLAILPLSAFAIPSEPFMELAESSAELRTGSKQVIRMKTMNPKVRVEVDRLPDGMKRVDNQLIWTPTPDDIGHYSVPVTLVFEQSRRKTNLSVVVRRPSVNTPVLISDFLVGDRNDFIACWSSLPRDLHGGFTTGRPDQRSELALVSLRKQSSPKKIVLPMNVAQATLMDARIAIVPVDDRKTVSIYDLKTMQRIKVIPTGSPIINIRSEKERLILEELDITEVFDLSTFRRVKSIPISSAEAIARGRGNQAEASYLDGVVRNGVLYDRKTNRPRLVIANTGIPVLQGNVRSRTAGEFLRRLNLQSDPMRMHRNNQSPSIVAGPLPLPNTNRQVVLESHQVQLDHAKTGYSIEQRVSLAVMDSDGLVRERIPITHERYRNQLELRRPNAKIAGGNVMISVGRRIFRWSPRSLESEDAVTESASGNSSDRSSNQLYFEPEQSCFVLTGQSTKFAHQLRGGNGPMSYFLITDVVGVSLDEDTGAVTVKRDPLVRLALERFRMPSRSKERSTSDAIKAMKLVSATRRESVKRITGKSLKGSPNCFPIHLKATDADGNVAEIRYFVFFDMPFRSVAKKMAER